MQPSRFRRLNLLIALVTLVGVAAVALATQPKKASAEFTLHLQPVLSGLRQPLDLRQAPDGSDRFFMAEKGGVIRVSHGDQLLEPPFLDLRDLVGARGSEQGLLGMAFHPRYAENGFFFVNYTDPNGDSVIARYQVSADPDVADPASGSVILFQPQPYANHNGGNLVFGPDGYLWIGLGDGGSSGDPRGNGQNPATWLGKMLRIDVDGAFPYLAPADNAPGALPEVWAIGLRNPWRYTFDRANGDLYIGDVGQNVWEEIDYVGAGTPAGQNFGWNVAEGNHCFRSMSCDLSPFVPALAEYDHRGGDCAVVSGYVYRGAAFAAMQGVYFYADECTGRIWSLARDETGAPHVEELMRTRINISSFGEDAAGELYVTGLNDGVVYRLTAE
ncbi:MAG: PQQ-dependent sugar dehydrogenase [Chloroflexota bacterium]|nr:PQQ-dependent sugar dehydrogenase [Chloroflexota bacterium]